MGATITTIGRGAAFIVVAVFAISVLAEIGRVMNGASVSALVVLGCLAVAHRVGLVPHISRA